jgi:di/tricarboxylate transporter
MGPWPGLTLVSVQGANGGPVHGRLLAEGDRVIVRGAADAAGRLAADRHLALRPDAAQEGVAETFFNKASGLAEVVIPPRSGLIGQAMFPGMITPSGDLVVLSVQRRGEDLAPKEPLAAGDTLLLQGTWKALDTHLADPDVVVVDSPEMVRRQAVPLGAGSTVAIVVLLGMVAALATGALPAAVAGLLAACALVLFRVVSVEEAYRSINWTTVILVGAMTPLSTAMTQTGAARLLADGLIRLVGGAGPYALLAGLFLLTAILGQLISNMATALIMIPIAVAAAREVGSSPLAVLLCVNRPPPSSTLTPVATPVNLMVMAPAGYQFGDYWKLGGLCLLWFFLVAVFLVPVFWPL